MSKLEITKGVDFLPNRRAFLGTLGGALMSPIFGVKNAVADVIDIENNEAARRDIILALRPSLFGKERDFGAGGYSTIQNFRTTLSSIREVKLDFLIKNVNALGAEEFNFFKGETSEEVAKQILDAIKQYKATLPQTKREIVEESETTRDGNERVNETMIRDITTRELDYMRVTKLPVNKEFTRGDGSKYRQGVKEVAEDVPDARVDAHFYGNNVGKNIPGTYINQSLSRYIGDEIPQSISSSDAYIKVSLAGGKYYVALYMNGTLKLLSYVSPGMSFHNKDKYSRRTTSPVRLEKVVGRNFIFNKYRMSGTHDESAMYLSIDIQNGEFFHASMLGVDGLDHSHGCIRLPIFYIYGMNQLLQSLQKGEKVIIDIDRLYS